MTELLSLLWSIAAIAGISVLYGCWRAICRVLERFDALDERLNRLEVSVHQASDRVDTLDASLQRVAREAASRDRLRLTEQPVLRHDSAIRDARDGMSADELARRHGISHAEARLIVTLHGAHCAPVQPIDAA